MEGGGLQGREAQDVGLVDVSSVVVQELVGEILGNCETGHFCGHQHFAGENKT